jgi:glycosyltransferase involved in cell wall biosynthesis
MHVILVASWYPAVDDPARGRFVADQAEALERTGSAHPVVLSFDPLTVGPSLLSRPGELGAASRLLDRALEGGLPALNPRAYGLAGNVPVTRLPVIDGEALVDGAEADARASALEALADRTSFPDSGVVHAHTAYPDGFAAARLARRLGWPLVITEHASFVGRQLGRRGVRERYLAAADSAARFIAVSEFLASELRTSIPTLREKLVVVPNPIRPEDFTMSALGDRRPGELLFVGYRKARKGIPVLLQAFSEILAARPTATLRLVGQSSTDAEEDRWHAMARELAIDDAVRFDPPADRAGVAAALARAALYVHPSPRETFGITTLEALASGLPVVATRSGGISAILEDPALGELVPVNDPPALAAAVLRTLDRREQFVPEVLRAAVAPFTDQAVAARLLEIYGAVGGGRTETRTMAGAAPPAWTGPMVAVGTGSTGIGRVSLLPDDLRRRLLVVDLPLAGDAAAAGAQHHAGRVRRRMNRLVRPGVALVQRAWARNPVSARRRAALRRTWGAEIRRRTAEIGERPEVICLDAVSAWIAEPLVVDGSLRAVPGGILWLADRWAALQSSASPSRESTSDATRSPTTGQS